MNAAEALLALASQLSPRARELLLADTIRLETNNDRTREFVGQAGPRNPLRPPSRFVRTHELPPAEWLTEPETAAVAALYFTASGVYADDVATFARWIGPDGVVVLTKTNDRRYLRSAFEDGTGVVVGPADRRDAHEQTEPNVTYLESSGDVFDDYRAALEGTAQHILLTGQRPLYRYNSPALDFDAFVHTWEHHMPLRTAAVIRGGLAVKWVVDKVEQVGKSLESGARDRAEKFAAELERRATVTPDGIVCVCQGCQQKVRVPFEKLGALAKCARCGGPLPTTDFPLDAPTRTALARLISRAPIPLLVDFWAPWCGPCVVNMPMLERAAAKSEGRFAIVRVNGDAVPDALTDHNVVAFPTMLRFHDGAESGRGIGPKPVDKIVDFGLGGLP